MILCYTALSPFCRKVRMAMEYKGIEFALSPGDEPAATAAYNPRAEVPILIDGEIVVCNSPDILAYLDRKLPSSPLYPTNPEGFARVREWERFADTVVDPIMTVIGNWRFAELDAMPHGLMDAARRDAGAAYDALEVVLSQGMWVAGRISAADFALYPHVTSGAALGLPFDPSRHPNVRRWLKAMKARPEGQSDLFAAREWWARPSSRKVDTERINWGSFRLEWLLANGNATWFAGQVREEKVLWSTGPQSNARVKRHRS